MNEISLHADLWARLLERRERLPHALLFAGQRGLGKFALARAFAAGLLCESPGGDGRACGRCLACNWHSQGNHPDFRLLQPDALSEAEGAGDDKETKKKASQQITIDQVRELDGFLSVGTHRSGLRIVIVHPAEAMNRSTANALLKTLEEPAPGTLFLLVSNEPLRLLPTIRSRCQAVPVGLPPVDRSVAFLREAGVADPEQWLGLAGGAPLLAAELAGAGTGGWLEQLVACLAAGRRGDALGSAAEVDRLVRESKGKVGLRQVVEWAQKWTVDLLLARKSLPVRYFSRHQATIAALVQGVAAEQLIRFHRRLLQARRQVEQPLNARLFLEEFFLDYRTLFAE